ncbi:hypothetical protein BDA99DRAFT_101287 [Phascolomyces articulosus]|uniref:Uncharacterized protein n=1 Tax=Phascolomyces articulosus TaxID=60185 RepID=A0AAD5JX98_9FUNG|nr:hypothetical protein BDA99DRAFT_101287 [Phascolomyces articulosus]
MAIKKKNTAPLDHHYEYFLKVLRDNPLASNIELTTMVNEQFKPAKFTEGQIKYWISQIPFTIEELARIAYYFYEMKRPLKQENTIYIPSKHSHYYDGLIQYINLSKGTYKSRSPEAIILVLEILHNQKNIHKNVRKKFVELKPNLHLLRRY